MRRDWRASDRSIGSAGTPRRTPSSPVATGVFNNWHRRKRSLCRGAVFFRNSVDTIEYPGFHLVVESERQVVEDECQTISRRGRPAIRIGSSGTGR